MSFVRNFIDFLNGSTPAASPGQPQPSPSLMQGNSSDTDDRKPDSESGHIERRKVVFRQVGPNDMVSESEEAWRQNGGTMEGDTIHTKVLSASGQVVEIEDLKICCHVCGLLDDGAVRSQKSHVPLCRKCMRIFEMPDGSEIIVTPEEQRELSYRFDTWARYDARRKGGSK